MKVFNRIKPVLSKQKEKFLAQGHDGSLDIIIKIIIIIIIIIM